MKVIACGPTGALLGLANVDAELHGVRAKRVPSGRICSNERGHGETNLLVCYVDGRRSTRQAALARLSQHIAQGQKIEISGRIEVEPFKVVLCQH